MPEKTTNLNLPIPLGNENVNRQYFVDLIQAIDSGAVSEEQLAKAISAIKIELVDVFDSTDKQKAPSADALRRGLETKQNTLRLADNYLAASVLINASAADNGGEEYPNGVSMFKVSTSTAGWPAANGYVLTFRVGSGGYQVFYESYSGTIQNDKTVRQWTRSKKEGNAFWQAWARVLTESDYSNGQISNSSDLNNYKNPGTYYVGGASNLANFPTGAYGYGVLEVVRAPGMFALQQVYRAHVGSNVYVRSYFDDGRAWEPWHRLLDDDDYNELFQSVANGKASLKTAISGKGGTINQAGSAPTFAELSAAINTVRTGGYGNISKTLAEVKGSTEVINGSWVRSDLFYIPPCYTAVIIPQSSDNLASEGRTMYELAPIRTSMRIDIGATSSNSQWGGVTAYYLLVDDLGNQINLYARTPGTSGTEKGFLISVFVDFVARTCVVQSATEQYGTFQDSTQTSNIAFPTTFAINKKGVTLQAALNYNFNSSYYYSWSSSITSTGRIIYS